MTIPFLDFKSPYSEPKVDLDDDYRLVMESDRVRRYEQALVGTCMQPAKEGVVEEAVKVIISINV